MFYRSTSTFITGVSAVVKWISHYILSHTLSPILFPNKGSSVCVEMKICILFINNNGALVASLQKRKKRKEKPFPFLTLSLFQTVGLTARGSKEADVALQTLQPDEVILPGCTHSTYAHITHYREWTREGDAHFCLQPRDVAQISPSSCRFIQFLICFFQ